MRTSDLDLPPSAPRVRIGVEHELRLWRDAEQVDFRAMIGEVAGQLATLDPGDPRSRRLPSGTALTADGWEAELASPPLLVDRSAPARVDDLLRAERTELRDRVTELGVTRVGGFSTHLNITVADDLAVRTGRAFVDTCVRGLAAITEPASSSGVLVRPRRGRLEIGTEYVEGERLVAALTVLVACRARLIEVGPAPLGPVPATAPSREKYGWFVPPEELGGPDDLARLWAWARPACLSAGLDPQPVDRLVGTPRCGAVEPCSFGGAGGVDETAGTAPRTLRAGVRASTEWLTWDHVVWGFGAEDGGRCRAVVPAAAEPDFLRRLDNGQLDPLLERMLRRPVVRRRLLVNAQLKGPSLWHDVRPGALVPAERLPDGRVPRVSRRRARRDLVRLLREERR